MKILILEPFFCDSHAAWAQAYAGHSLHQVDILSLGGYFWKWRMHGGAVTLAGKFLDENHSPDLILASDMLDLSTFLALTRKRTADIPAAVYFHENQLSYPWSPADRDIDERRDEHYGFINYVSALCADAVFFNSRYHQESFLSALKHLLEKFPDHQELESVSNIESKSRVLPLGLDLRRFDSFKSRSAQGERPARILWNHRWEYDKNPEGFFSVLKTLHERGLFFEVILLGKSFRRKPAIFQEAKKILGERIIQFGFVKSLAEYAKWLWSADIIPVTSRQDFFGISVMEAIYCGCFPLLPKRLAYPELIPEKYHPAIFYHSDRELAEKLEQAIIDIEKIRNRKPGYDMSHIAKPFDWRAMASEYDKLFAGLL